MAGITTIPKASKPREAVSKVNFDTAFFISGYRCAGMLSFLEGSFFMLIFYLISLLIL
jgi:hypothetical protein